jgi:phage terminase large subunit GpA-like protein
MQPNLEPHACAPKRYSAQERSSSLFPHLFAVPDWLPPHIRSRLAGQPVSFAIPRQVRLRMRHPEKMRVSEWAEKYRMVTDGAHEGPWRHEYAPHTVKIMDAFGMPWVREVWLCGVEQSGKTNTILNCIGWAVDCDPGNIFYLMPTEDAAQKITGGKLKPMMQKSARLARYLSRKVDDTSLARINLQHGVTIFPAHANSATSMATWSAKHCFGDEIDKYPPMAGKETDPITLIKKRNRTYKGRFKRVFASTPAGLFIYQGMLSCHQVWEYRVKCPDCGGLVKMVAEHLIFQTSEVLKTSEVSSPESVERDGCQYACNACASIWGDQKREEAIRLGRWFCIKGDDIARPAKVGFHHRAWECLDITLAEIGAAYLRAQTSDQAARIAWANGYEAIDYKAEISEREEDTILRLRDNRAAGVVPAVADALEISIDTQDNGFWYRIRAWQYGLALTSWLVKAGYVESRTPDDFSSLDSLLAAEYPDENGEPHRIMAGIIDSSGHRTAEVYAWCRVTGVLAAKGAPGRKTQPVTVSRIDRFPGNNRPIPGGLALYHIDTHYHKDQLANKLLIDPTDPGALILHSGLTYDQHRALERDPGQQFGHNLHDYSRQMCSEYRDDRNLWQCPENRANHLWDCESGGLALVTWLGWQNAVSEKTKRPTVQKTAVRQTQTTGNNRPGWFNNR